MIEIQKKKFSYMLRARGKSTRFERLPFRDGH
jgi:hypothetical protein